MKHIDLSPFIGRVLTDADWQHLMMRILFAPKDTGESHAEALIRKAVKHSGLNAEMPDPLLSLLGFSKETLPEMNHIFNAELGLLFETIVKVLFMISNPELYRDDFTEDLKKLSKGDLAKYKKCKPDFAFGDNATEIKYRFGSHEALEKQKGAAEAIQKMGMVPVLISLRSSPNTTNVVATTNWKVYEGKDCLNYIQERTGFDLVRIFNLAAANPLIRRRIRELQDLYDRNTRARLSADFEYALERHREPVHRFIAEDDNAREEFLADIGFDDDLMAGMMDYLLKNGSSALENPEIKHYLTETAQQIQQIAISELDHRTARHA